MIAEDITPNLLEEAKDIIEFAESEYGYKPAINWNESPTFIPADANISNNLYLEFCLIKLWLRKNHEIIASENYNGNQWVPLVESMNENVQIPLDTTNLYDDGLPALIEAVRQALNFLFENKPKN